MTFLVGQQGGSLVGGGTNNLYNPVTITFAGSPTITGANSFTANQTILLNTVGGTYPTGSTTIQNAQYYVSPTGLSSSGFQLSASYNGPVITYTGTSTGTITAQAVSTTFSGGQSMWYPTAYSPTAAGTATAFNTFTCYFNSIGTTTISGAVYQSGNLVAYTAPATPSLGFMTIPLVVPLSVTTGNSYILVVTWAGGGSGTQFATAQGAPNNFTNFVGNATIYPSNTYVATLPAGSISGSTTEPVAFLSGTVGPTAILLGQACF